MERVESKQLFTYQLNGVLDEEVEAIEWTLNERYLSDPEFRSMKILVDNDSADINCTVAAGLVRKYLPVFVEHLDKTFKMSVDKCIHTDLEVPLRDGNDFAVPVLVHTPIFLAEGKSNAAIIYAHGGGCVAGNALMFKSCVSHMAIETGVVVFNVDYRLAPETKFPKNVLDFYCAVKHVIENAEHLGIDRSRIAIASDSGGGYICFATMVMLAQKCEGNLVKVAIPSGSMISDYCFTDVDSMTLEEREAAPSLKKMWRCIANDLEAERDDPLLFPAKSSDDILQKMPPTIIWENEFDIFITEATRMAHRMRSVGRLLEFRVQPGMTHMSHWIPETKGIDDNIRDYKLAVKEYLL